MPGRGPGRPTKMPPPPPPPSSSPPPPPSPLLLCPLLPPCSAAEAVSVAAETPPTLDGSWPLPTGAANTADHTHSHDSSQNYIYMYIIAICTYTYTEQSFLQIHTNLGQKKGQDTGVFLREGCASLTITMTVSLTHTSSYFHQNKDTHSYTHSTILIYTHSS